MKAPALLLFLALLGSVTGTAQEAIRPTASYFEAEGSRFYDAIGCKAGTPVQFYSQTGGGTILCTATADAKGLAHIKLQEKERTPAFALDLLKPRGGKAGDQGTVSFYNAQEFSFDHPELTAVNSQARLSWQASAAKTETISFAIIKSTDGGPYVQAGQVAATSGGDSTAYSWTDPAGYNLGAIYQIAVINAKTGERFRSEPLQSGALAVAYPTITTGSVQVAVAASISAMGYTLVNMEGQPLANGKMTGGVNLIDLSRLPPGAYLLRLSAANREQVIKLIRQ